MKPGYDSMYSDVDIVGGGILGAVVAVYLLMIFAALTFSVACYVFQSLGTYTIAGRRGIKNAWLTWLPIGNLWILGSISDQYQYVAKGKVKNRRKILLGLSIGVFVFYFVWIVSAVVSTFASLTAGVLVLVLGALLFLALAVIMTVYQYMCLYDLFSSCQPSNAVLYLVLSIFVTVTMPFFVFACRKKDLGMPPRKQPVAPRQIVEPAEEEIAEEPAEESVTEEDFVQPEEFEEE